MTLSPVLTILKLQHEKVEISVKNKLMSKNFLICSILTNQGRDSKWTSSGYIEK